ncbi:MAG TPA: polysaccharide deacetylase family protein [Cytophagaceae bacterium]|jgi:chitin deacetylase
MSIPKLITYALGTLLPLASFSQTTLNYTIANWFDNKKAATSLTFDDAISGQFTDAIPILDANDFKSTFFLISQSVPGQLGGWAPVVKALRGGHEIANHTVTHPTLAELTNAEVDAEFKGCNDAIFSNVKVKAVTMAYPNGSGGGSTAEDQRVRNIAKKYFIGARAAGGDNNPYSFGDSEENYFLIRSPMINDGTTASDMANMLNNTISSGGWFCPTYHGVVNGWIIVSKELFQAHIDEFVKRKGDLWVSTFGNVLKYHRERKSAKLTKVSEDPKAWVLSLSDTLRDNAVWSQPLTLNLDKPSWPIFYISQNGKDIPYKTVSNKIVFNAVPDGGEIKIGKEAVLAVEDKNETEANWSIIPNPISESINIFNLKEGNQYKIEIVSVNGSFRKTVEETAKNSQIAIVAKEFQKGIYIITINGVSKKIVVQ